ncbi:MAG: hypothetical protein EOO22_00795 [Comamonadaceae bacterium]|nr:MAG: hypothetical protein EOO22_00795 [Comamonadaceae bacterium]
MKEAAHIDGWKAQTEYAAEYSHRGARWGLNFYAVDEDDAKKKLRSIRETAELLGPVAERISMDGEKSHTCVTAGRSTHQVAPSKAPEVEIISNGVSRLVYVNRHRIDKVLDIDTNAGLGDLNPRVALTLHARSITQRLVSGEEWKRLAHGGALEG